MKQIIALLVDAPDGQTPTAMGKIVDALGAARKDARYVSLTVSEEELRTVPPAELGERYGTPLIAALAVNYLRPPALAFHPDAFKLVTKGLDTDPE